MTLRRLVGLVVLPPFGVLYAQAGPGSAPAPMMNHFPQWSPTANVILFDSDRDGDSEVYVMDPDRRTVRQLTSNRAADGTARWTADGQLIVFQSDRDGPLKTYRMRPDGSGVQPVEADDGSERALSVQGVRVMVAPTRDGYHALFRATTDWKPETQLTEGAQASQPSFSPGGLSLIYEELPLDGDFFRARVVLLDRDGTHPRPLALGTDPSWSPDGSLILFKTPTNRAGGFGWEVATVRPDGSALLRLAPGVHPSWSPDGSRIAYMVETRADRTDIWMMDRDGSNQTCLTCAH